MLEVDGKRPAVLERPEHSFRYRFPFHLRGGAQEPQE
jgi:hypothetical protein